MLNVYGKQLQISQQLASAVENYEFGIIRKFYFLLQIQATFMKHHPDWHSRDIQHNSSEYP